MLANRRQTKRAQGNPVSVSLGSRAVPRPHRVSNSRARQLSLKPMPRLTPGTPFHRLRISPQIKASQQHGCRCRPTCGPHRGRRGWNRPAPAPCCGLTGTLARTCATRKLPAGLNAASFCSVCCKTWGTLRARTPSGLRVCRQTRQLCLPLHHSRKVPMWQTPMFSGLEPCSSKPEA